MRYVSAAVCALVLCGCLSDMETGEPISEFGISTIRLPANGDCDCSQSIVDDDCDYRYVPAVGYCEYYGGGGVPVYEIGEIFNASNTYGIVLSCAVESFRREDHYAIFNVIHGSSVKFYTRNDNADDNDFYVYSYDIDYATATYEGSCTTTDSLSTSCMVDDLTTPWETIAVTADIKRNGSLTGYPAFYGFRLCLDYDT